MIRVVCVMIRLDRWRLRLLSGYGAYNSVGMEA